MTEQLFFTMVGLFGYYMAYLAIGCSITAIWKNWAWKTAGEFWEFNLNEGMKLYYPGFWWFIRHRKLLYSALYIIFWPVMVPGQIIINSKVLRRVMSREYWY